jgi:hypothetical protein
MLSKKSEPASAKINLNTKPFSLDGTKNNVYLIRGDLTLLGNDVEQCGPLTRPQDKWQRSVFRSMYIIYRVWNYVPRGQFLQQDFISRGELGPQDQTLTSQEWTFSTYCWTDGWTDFLHP